LPLHRERERDIIGQGNIGGKRRMMEHVIWMDSEVIPGAYYSECVWFWSQNMPNQMARPVLTPEQIKGGGGVPPHAHPFPELLSFFGTDMEHPELLNGVIEFWLEDEQFLLDRSFVVYIPAGMKHAPLRMPAVNRPLFHFTIGPGETYQ
jgi:hypothetical protein